MITFLYSHNKLPWFYDFHVHTANLRQLLGSKHHDFNTLPLTEARIFQYQLNFVIKTESHSPQITL